MYIFIGTVLRISTCQPCFDRLITLRITIVQTLVTIMKLWYICGYCALLQKTSKIWLIFTRAFIEISADYKCLKMCAQKELEF